eukprot:439348-Rhodomonas_salina.1
MRGRFSLPYAECEFGGTGPRYAATRSAVAICPYKGTHPLAGTSAPMLLRASVLTRLCSYAMYGTAQA